MSVIYVLIPIAILLTVLGIYLFFWAVKTDQFDDLEKQGLSILFDDDHKKQQSSAKTSAGANLTEPQEHTQVSNDNPNKG